MALCQDDASPGAILKFLMRRAALSLVTLWLLSLLIFAAGQLLPGDVGRAAGAEVAGCIFAGRCPIAKDRCHRETPPMADLGGQIRCHIPAEQLRISPPPSSD